MDRCRSLKAKQQDRLSSSLLHWTDEVRMPSPTSETRILFPHFYRVLHHTPATYCMDQSLVFSNTHDMSYDSAPGGPQKAQVSRLGDLHRPAVVELGLGSVWYAHCCSTVRRLDHLRAVPGRGLVLLAWLDLLAEDVFLSKLCPHKGHHARALFVFLSFSGIA